MASHERDSQEDGDGKHPEHSEPQPRTEEYSFEYFHAQVAMAYKWAKLYVFPQDIADVLLQKTAIYRRIFGFRPSQVETLHPLWDEIAEKARQTTDPLEFTRYLYNDVYLQDLGGVDHIYRPPVRQENDDKHFGFFHYEYYPQSNLANGENAVKIHFTNIVPRPKSGLRREFAAQRRTDLTEMFQHIQTHHPEVTTVLGGSWIYHIPEYRNTFPPEFTEQAKKIDRTELASLPNGLEEMTQEGNSLWGQFVRANGAPKQKEYEEFLRKVSEADTIIDLYNAFPVLPLRVRVNIEAFYTFLKIPYTPR